jgi:DNA adenine methylase
MQYLGGKSKIAKHIVQLIDGSREPGQLVWDAFCGGLAVSAALTKKGPVWSTDYCAALISLYEAVRLGWAPPEQVSKETWAAAKSLPDTDPMKAFCGFGCSFGGKWFGGYMPAVESHVVGPAGIRAGLRVEHHRHRASARRLAKDCRSGLQFACVDFLSVEPEDLGCVLYLDPPYAGTTSYAGVPAFDLNRFVQRVSEWSRFCDVFVSEYDFPLGEIVWSASCEVKRGMSKAGATERLYFIPRK